MLDTEEKPALRIEALPLRNEAGFFSLLRQWPVSPRNQRKEFLFVPLRDGIFRVRVQVCSVAPQYVQEQKLRCQRIGGNVCAAKLRNPIFQCCTNIHRFRLPNENQVSARLRVVSVSAFSSFFAVATISPTPRSIPAAIARIHNARSAHPPAAPASRPSHPSTDARSSQSDDR